MSEGAGTVESVRKEAIMAVPTTVADVQRCPRLGALDCQRSDAHARGHVYHGAWAPDRHDAQD
jgi:hypothetical protein